MNDFNYQALAAFLLENSGLVLGDGKMYLVESRLTPICKQLGIDDLDALIARLRAGDPGLSKLVVEAMTTNETSFFRDKGPFDELTGTLVPELLEKRRSERRLRIWCAAGSTGQEPYSIIMSLREKCPELAGWQIDLLATDIDSQAIAHAQEGVYTQFEVQRGLPIQLLVKYFSQVDGGWQVKPELRDCVRWEQLNLLKPFHHVGDFDVIFCRNVLIYFNTDRKAEILGRMVHQVDEGGYLILGAAETVIGVTDVFKRYTECQSAVYRPTAQVVGV
ncbi:MAG: protein-glutamate O-methyltransferase [Planctomycetota bacterium]